MEGAPETDDAMYDRCSLCSRHGCPRVRLCDQPDNRDVPECLPSPEGNNQVTSGHRFDQLKWRIHRLPKAHGMSLSAAAAAAAPGDAGGGSGGGREGSERQENRRRRRLCVCTRIHQNNADRPVDLVKVKSCTQSMAPNPNLHSVRTACALVHSSGRAEQPRVWDARTEAKEACTTTAVLLQHLPQPSF